MEDPRKRNKDINGMDFSIRVRDIVWEKGYKIPNFSSKKWRWDVRGIVMRKIDFGVPTKYGWEIDHIIPIIKGGNDDIKNLQPLHWYSNQSKSDKENQEFIGSFKINEKLTCQKTFARRLITGVLIFLGGIFISLYFALIDTGKDANPGGVFSYIFSGFMILVGSVILFTPWRPIDNETLQDRQEIGKYSKYNKQQTDMDWMNHENMMRNRDNVGRQFGDHGSSQG